MPWFIKPGKNPIWTIDAVLGAYHYDYDTETGLYLALNPRAAKLNGAPLVIANQKRKADA